MSIISLNLYQSVCVCVCVHAYVCLCEQEMPPREYNGPGFQYKVSWRQAGGRGPHWSHAYTPRPPMLVNDSGVFTPWEIKVQAVNSLGEARELAVAHKGHSGEDG